MKTINTSLQVCDDVCMNLLSSDETINLDGFKLLDKVCALTSISHRTPSLIEELPVYRWLLTLFDFLRNDPTNSLMEANVIVHVSIDNKRSSSDSIKVSNYLSLPN